MTESDGANFEDEHPLTSKIERQLQGLSGDRVRLAVRLNNGTQLIGRLVTPVSSRAITIELQGDEMTVAVGQIESIEVI